MLESPGRRDVGLPVGVMDSDETIRTLALTAALEGCPRRALTIVRACVPFFGSSPKTGVFERASGGACCTIGFGGDRLHLLRR